MRISRSHIIAALSACLIIACGFFGSGAAHAQSYTAIPHWNSGDQTSYEYNARAAMPAGQTNATMSGGSEIAQSVVAVDYGQISNVFLTRLTPALVVVAVSGAVILAALAAVRMIHGRLAGAFH